MCLFPLPPRQSRIIVEAIVSYPEVLEEVIIAAAFLSAQNPFILPPGKEMDARKAHHGFRDPAGDFASFLKIFRLHKDAKNRARFCEVSFLDERVMAEIANIKDQLEMVVSDMGIPVLSGGSTDDYLCCIASGMIQFVCVHDGIHPGSCMYREEPQYIVAGEIVRTSRMYAMSVSPLSKALLARIDENLVAKLSGPGKGKGKRGGEDKRREASGASGRDGAGGRDGGRGVRNNKGIAASSTPASGIPATGRPPAGSGAVKPEGVTFGGEFFEIKKIKGKKQLDLPWVQLGKALASVDLTGSFTAQVAGLRGKILFGSHELLAGEKMDLIIRIATTFNLEQAGENDWPRKQNFVFADNPVELLHNLQWLFRVTVAKQKSKELGFICLFTDGKGQYWFKCSRGFHTALNESIASLESLIDEIPDNMEARDKERINSLYRKLNSFFS